MPTEQELDQIFLAAAERAGGIQPLLTSFFGFLHRRTDFYIEHGGVKGRAYDAGFAPGQAEAMVRAAFMAPPPRPLEGSNVERSAAAHRAGCEATLVERARERLAGSPGACVSKQIVFGGIPLLKAQMKTHAKPLHAL